MSGKDLSERTCNGTPIIDTEKPCNLEAVPELVKAVVSAADALNSGTIDARQDLLVKLRTLTSAVETPRETMLKHCWTMTTSIACLSFGIDSGLWVAMAKNGDRPQTVHSLATEIGADPILLSRVMRHLGSTGHIDETGQDEYRPTVFSKALSISTLANGLIGLTCTTGAAALKFHEYSRKSGWKNPTDSKYTPLMYAYGTDKDMFSWIQSQGYGTHFNDHMDIYRPMPWISTGRFPIEQRLIDGADKSPNAPFWVDIGGCTGRDLMELHHYYPQVPGKLILQDLPPVINEIKNIHPAITPMEYDFLTEQPIKGSRAYYMHSVLHDWPDDICQKILARIIDAMKGGYSKLLIHESVVPPTNASWETTARDIIMLTLCCSQERNEADWRKLLEGKAGLRISKIWKLDMPDECLIECELP